MSAPRLFRPRVLVAAMLVTLVPLWSPAEEEIVYWHGRYEGSMADVPAHLSLQEYRGELGGIMEVEDRRYRLKADLDGASASGTMHDLQTDGYLNITAHRVENRLEMTMTYTFLGQPIGDPMKSTFIRMEGSADTSPALVPDPAEFLDERLFGSWTRTESDATGNPVPGRSIRLSFKEDGTFLLTPSGSGPKGPVTMGRWKSDRGLLLLNNGLGWAVYGTYECSGGDLLMTQSDGNQQFWKKGGD